MLIRHGESYFLLQRTPKQTEARLHHKLSLGIGGHINPDTPDLLDGLQKELEEEVDVAGDYDLTFVGILNDDTTDVGRVHLGAVYVLDAHDGKRDRARDGEDDRAARVGWPGARTWAWRSIAMA